MAGSVADYLLRLGAHHDLVSWAQPYAGDFERAWRECPRGDWLLGVAVRSGLSARERMLAAAACARLGLEWLEDPAPAATALDALERHVREGDGALREHTDRLAAVVPRDPATGAALSAVVLALGSAEDAELAASVPATVVEAAMYAVGDCGVMSLLRHTQSATAEAVRAHVSFANLSCRESE
ncbi:MAG: hypothetical protein R3B13_28540 [Polyangiaceae bacterium]